jgi:hypothetical protein
VDEPDRDGVQKMELFAPAPSGDDETRLLEHLEVLHDAEAGHGEPPLERGQVLAILTEELVQQAAPSRVGEGFEHLVHTLNYR